MKKKISELTEAEIDELLNEILNSGTNSLPENSKFSYVELDMGNLAAYAAGCGAWSPCGYTCDTTSGCMTCQSC